MSVVCYNMYGVFRKISFIDIQSIKFFVQEPDFVNKFPLEFLFEPAEMHKDWYRKKCEAEEKKKQAEREEAEKEEELRLLKKLKLKYEQK